MIILLNKGIITPLILFIILVFGAVISLISKFVKIPVIWWFLEKFERKEQLKTLPGKGALALFAGTLLSVKLFEMPVALAAISILTFGDPISHFIGQHFGRIKSPLNEIKMLEGNFVGAIIGGAFACIFVAPAYAFLSAAIALLIESIEIKMGEIIVDDNIVIPLSAGTAILVLKTIF
jgi:dolichol kinase